MLLVLPVPVSVALCDGDPVGLRVPLSLGEGATVPVVLPVAVAL